MGPLSIEPLTKETECDKNRDIKAWVDVVIGQQAHMAGQPQTLNYTT